MSNLIFFILVVPILIFVLYLGGSAVMAGVKAKEEKKQHEVAVKKESRSGALTWLIVLGVIALLVALLGF